MQFVINFTVEELKTHKEFKKHHSDAQAEAVYELLLDETGFREPTISYLRKHKIINKTYQYDDVPATGWASIIDSYLVINLIKE